MENNKKGVGAGEGFPLPRYCHAVLSPLAYCKPFADYPIKH